jgi:uncharacterized membrane protein
MRRRKWIFVAAPVGFALFVFLGGEVVKELWNWLAPPLFGLPLLTFWQALGLLALCRILFGGWGGHGRRTRHMSEEERERIRQRLRERCGMAQPPQSTEG